MDELGMGAILTQMRITNRLLAAQLRGTMGQKDLVRLLVTTGATYKEIAATIDTTEATVEVTARRLRSESKVKRASSKRTRR